MEGFFPANPIIFGNLKAAFDKIFAGFTNRGGKDNLFVVDAVDQLEFVLSWPRSSAMEHFVIDQTDWPKIWFGSVFLFF